ILAAAGFFSLFAFLWLWRHRPWTRQLLSAVVVVGGTVGGYKALQSGLPSRTDIDRVASGRLETWGRSLAYLESPADWLVGVGLSRNHSFVSYTTAPLIEARRVGIRGGATDSTY